VLSRRTRRGSETVSSAAVPGAPVSSLGIGAIFVTATSTALANVPEHEAGLASGVVNTFHEVGGGIGIAVLSTIAAAGITHGTISGFARAFTLAAATALLAALASAFLIPPRKPQPASGADGA
jgi:sugar phosphate permease